MIEPVARPLSLRHEKVVATRGLPPSPSLARPLQPLGGLSPASAVSNHLHVRFPRSESEPSTWDSLSRRMAEARAVVLSGPSTDRRILLASLNLSERSTLGALVANCGGIVIDHGWLRMFAGGCTAMPSLPDANLEGGNPSGDHLVVAYDILGGRFAINGSGDRAARGEVCYLAPDTLEWFNLELGHTEFVHWALGDNVEQFYRNLRWPGWEHEVADLAFDQGLATYPPPFASQGIDIATTSRSAVPAVELFHYIDEAARQLAAVPDGEPFEFKFGD